MAHDFTIPVAMPGDLVDRLLAWATRAHDEHGLPIEASDWWLAAKEIERLRDALRTIVDCELGCAAEAFAKRALDPAAHERCR